MADVRLTVLPEAAQVVPGGRLSLTLTVQNDSRIVDRYQLTVNGVPETWYDLEKQEISLFPGAAERVQLTLHPPIGTATQAGSYPVNIQVASDDTTNQVTVAVTLLVTAVGRLSMDVLPAEHEGREAVFRVTFLNNSNSAATLNLAARDNEEGLRFQADPSGPIIVPAGGQSIVNLRVTPKRSPFFGAAHPYEIELRAPQAGDTGVDPFLDDVDPALLRQARFIYVPPSAGLVLPPWVRRLPGWAIMLALLLLVLLLVLAGRKLAQPVAAPIPGPLLPSWPRLVVRRSCVPRIFPRPRQLIQPRRLLPPLLGLRQPARHHHWLTSNNSRYR